MSKKKNTIKEYCTPDRLDLSQYNLDYDWQDDCYPFFDTNYGIIYGKKGEKHSQLANKLIAILVGCDEEDVAEYKEENYHYFPEGYDDGYTLSFLQYKIHDEEGYVNIWADYKDETSLEANEIDFDEESIRYALINDLYIHEKIVNNLVSSILLRKYDELYEGNMFVINVDEEDEPYFAIADKEVEQNIIDDIYYFTKGNGKYELAEYTSDYGRIWPNIGDNYESYISLWLNQRLDWEYSEMESGQVDDENQMGTFNVKNANKDIEGYHVPTSVSEESLKVCMKVFEHFDCDLENSFIAIGDTVLPFLKLYNGEEKIEISDEDMEQMSQAREIHLLSPEEKKNTPQIQNFLKNRTEKDNEKLSMYDLNGNFKGVMPKAKYNFYKGYGLGDSRKINGNLLKEYSDPDTTYIYDVMFSYEDENAFPFLNNSLIENGEFLYCDEGGSTHGDLLSYYMFDMPFYELDSEEKRKVRELRQSDEIEGRIWLLAKKYPESNMEAIISTWGIINESKKNILLEICNHYNVNPDKTYYLCENIAYWIGNNSNAPKFRHEIISNETKKELSDIFKHSFFDKVAPINSKDLEDFKAQRKEIHMLPPDEKWKRMEDFRNVKGKKIGDKLAMQDNQGNFKGEMPKAKYDFYKRYGLGDSKEMQGNLVENEMQYHPEEKDEYTIGFDGLGNADDFGHITEKKRKKIYISESKLQLLKENVTDIVYHFTTVDNASSIVSSDSFLTHSENNDDKYYLSVTRQRNSKIGYANEIYTNDTCVRLQLNGWKLNQSNSLTSKPWDFYGRNDLPSFKQRVKDDKFYLNNIESEDRIESKTKIISDFNKFIDRIDVIIIKDKYKDSILHLCKIALSKGLGKKCFIYDNERDFNFQTNNFITCNEFINSQANKVISYNEIMKQSALGEGKIGQSLINENVTDIVYHFTNIFALYRIISQNELHFDKGEFDTRPPRFPYYLSTTRTRDGRLGYSRSRKMVRIQLDGRMFNQNPRISSQIYNYFYDEDDRNTPKQRLTTLGVNAFTMNLSNYIDEVENEDRIISMDDKLKNTNQYITRIDLFFNRFSSDILSRLEGILTTKNFKLYADKIFVYDNEADYNSQTQNCVPLNWEVVDKYRKQVEENAQISENVEYEVAPSEIDTSSFEVQDSLAPEIWKDGVLNPQMRLKLLDIADDFFNTLDISWVKPIDIILTGSICNFNWSKYSDIDLHIVLDFREVDEHTDFVKTFFDSKKNEWNENHNELELFGYPVEIYVQDISEDSISGGIYSLEDNKWISTPNMSDFNDLDEADEDKLKIVSSSLMTKIDDFEERFKLANGKDELEKLNDEISDFTKNLKKLRQDGLAKSGEMNLGNLVYKVLRRTEYLSKIWDISNKIYDKLNSM